LNFSIKKRIDAELFIDRKLGLYIQNEDKETDQETNQDLTEEGKLKSAGK